MGRDSTRVSHYAPRPIIHARDRVAAIARVGESKRAISTSSANRNAPWVSGKIARKSARREKARARRAFRATRRARETATRDDARDGDARSKGTGVVDRARANGRTDARTDGGRRTC
jgi:hypothetical protein